MTSSGTRRNMSAVVRVNCLRSRLETQVSLGKQYMKRAEASRTGTADFHAARRR